MKQKLVMFLKVLSKFTLIVIGLLSIGLLTYSYSKYKLNGYIEDNLTTVNLQTGTYPPPPTSALGTYIPTPVVVTKLDESRVVKLIGEVNEDLARQVITDLASLNQVSNSRITLIINSPGGSILDGAAIVGAIQGSRSPVSTVCVSLCASMAALIHQYGVERLMFAHAVLMFHPAYGAAVDDIDRMSSMLGMFQRYTAKMEANAAARSGLTFEEYKVRSATQIWLDGEDAVNTRFADAVVFYKGTTITSIFKEIKHVDEEMKQRKSRRKFNVFLKSVTDYFISFFDLDEPLDIRLRSMFRND